MGMKEKLNLLFDELDCTDADIAARAGIHPSGISRFRTGKRMPTPRSSQLMGICEGIAVYADEQGTTNRLRELCDADERGSTESLPGRLFAWLFEGSLIYPEKRSNKEEHFLDESRGKFFSDKLNLVMNKLGISNGRMADAIHVNASVISRLRNRVRYPSSHEHITAICEFLYDRAETTGRLDILSSISDMPPNVDKEHGVTHLISWFSDVGESQNYQMMSRFLSRMDSFTPDAFPPLPPLEAIAPDSILSDTAQSYHGVAGLRKAVVRFLGSAAKLIQPVTLMLYSDQSMDWMTGDPEYRKVWAALMVYTLRAKNRIKIIHNIDRSLSEMVHAIEGWLPLYMSGLVEAYTHKKDAGGRFSHTLFISPGHDAVVSFFPCGMEDEGNFRYISGNEVEQYVHQHEAMIAASTPIVRVFPPGDTKGLLLLQRELADNPGELCRLLSAPSVETMSERTLNMILDRVRIDSAARIKIEEHHFHKRELNAIALNAGSIQEYIYLPERFQDRGFPLNMGDLFLDMELYYTEEEYAAHLADMQTLAEENINYSFIGVKERVFENMQITVKQNVGGLVMRSGLASILSSYWHPTMANAYYAYITKLMSGKMQREHGW